MKYRPIAAFFATCAALAPALAAAQTPDEMMKEIRRLEASMAGMKMSIQELEASLKTRDGASNELPSEQTRQLNRTVVRVDSLEEANETLGRNRLKISGVMDPSFIATSGQNRAGFQFLDSGENFEYAFDNGVFGMMQLDLQKEMDNGAKWRLSLSPNRGGGGIAINGKSIVHEASVSKPLSDDPSLRVIAGQIPDWSGYEFAQPNLNKLVTHNLLFDFTLPAVYTGAGLEKADGPWLFKAMLANVNASKRKAGEKAAALVYRGDYYASEFGGFGFAGMHGKAANFRADDGVGNPVTGLPYDLGDSVVNTFELDGYYIRGDWTINGQVSVGSQKNAAITADPVTGELRNSLWWGASALAAYKFTPRAEGVLRVDYLNNQKNGGGTLGWVFPDNRNGLGPDLSGDPEIGANRTAVSLGARFLIDQNMTLKTEFRLDRASLPVFMDQDGDYKRSNRLFGASLVMGF